MLALAMSAGAMAQSGTYSNMTAYPLPASAVPEEIAAGPDGALWFTDWAGGKIGRITTAGAITEYAPPTPNSDPFGIAAGPDGAMWFTEEIGKVGRIGPPGTIEEFDIPGSNPYGITLGPDGALWFADFAGNKIGRITTAGNYVEYPLPNPNSSPYEITAGPDGALWFTEFTGPRIGRITTAGAITEFPLSDQPWDITAGPDGALWFTQDFANQIGRITISGQFTEYPLPAPQTDPTGITGGPDGALWFTEEGTPARIGRITTSGVITAYPVTAATEGWRITTGPDGALWFTGHYNSAIGRAPACGLGVSATFANSTLTMNFNLGINTPATFAIHLRDASGPFAEPFTKNIPAVVPPQPFTMTWNGFPNLGEVTVQPTLATQPGGAGLGLCSEWTTVNTAQ